MVTAECNPFRVSRIEAIAYRAPGFSWEQFLAQLAAQGYRGAIVGPHGTGKTTLLLEAQARLEELGLKVCYGFLNEDLPRKGRVAMHFLRGVPEDAIVFLDGAEQLDLVSWQWFQWRARTRQGLVITAHAPGRLRTLHQTTSSEAALGEFLRELIPGEAEAMRRRANEHFLRLGGNVRETFFALYDDWAGREVVADRGHSGRSAAERIR